MKSALVGDDGHIVLVAHPYVERRPHLGFFLHPHGYSSPARAPTPPPPFARIPTTPLTAARCAWPTPWPWRWPRCRREYGRRCPACCRRAGTDCRRKTSSNG